MRKKRRVMMLMNLFSLIFHAMIYLTFLRYGLMGKFSSRRMNTLMRLEVNKWWRESG
jgi:hypothetical protein